MVNNNSIRVPKVDLKILILNVNEHQYNNKELLWERKQCSNYSQTALNRLWKSQKNGIFNADNGRNIPFSRSNRLSVEKPKAGFK